MIRSPLVRLAACALLALAVLPAQEASRLRVGTWNLEQFGRRQPPRTPEDLAAIAAYARDTMRVDVLAFQEVDGAPAMRELVAALGADWQFVIGTTGQIGGDAGQISVGFLWNDRRVELVQAEELMQLPREADGLPIFHRVPVSAVFRARDGGIDFRAITVHLKANGYPEKKQSDVDKRMLEAFHVLGHVRELLARDGEDRDVLVLGDFNHGFDDPAYGVFTQGGTLRYLRTKGDPSTLYYDNFRNRPIDHVAITGDLDEEYVADSRRVHGTLDDPHKRDDWKQRYSDHAPVTIDLDSSRDRDPASRFTPPLPGQLLGPGGMVAAVSAASPAAASEVRAGSTVTTRARGAAFAAGQRVVVHWLPDGGPHHAVAIQGRLLAPLGDWVSIETDEGNAIALPRERVMQVTRAD